MIVVQHAGLECCARARIVRLCLRSDLLLSILPTHCFIGTSYAPDGARRRRGTGAPLCYAHSWQRVAVSVRAVVPCARIGAWIGEPAASSLVTTRPVSPGRRRSRWEDCLHPPLPRPLPPCVGLPLPVRNGVPHLWRQLWPSCSPSCSAS